MTYGEAQAKRQSLGFVHVIHVLPPSVGALGLAYDILGPHRQKALA